MENLLSPFMLQVTYSISKIVWCELRLCHQHLAAGPLFLQIYLATHRSANPHSPPTVGVPSARCTGGDDERTIKRTSKAQELAK